MENIKIKALPQHNIQLGAGLTTNGIWFGAVFNPDSECGVILYPESLSDPIKIIFPHEAFTGRVCQVEITFSDSKKLSSFMKCKDGRGLRYMLFENDRVYPDPYMRDNDHLFEFGYKGDFVSRIDTDNFKSNNSNVSIDFDKSIFYLLHVRGYTAHSTSKVSAKGTFKGLKSKLSYISELGFTSIILMPVYEFNEIIEQPQYMHPETPVDEPVHKAEHINFWGYTDGFYFVPKSAYSSSGDSVKEFHELVDCAHKLGLEIILQFYFPSLMSSCRIIEVLRFWHSKYNVDGFELIGGDIPIDDVLADPYLYDLKILFNQAAHKNFSDINPNHGYIDYGYMSDMRSFLKGDPNSSYKAAIRIKENDGAVNPVNFIARQDTMRLLDIVSYNEKHNDANGENGRDGSDINYSWNCGIEGPTKKRNINELREKQIKNALAFVFLSKGVPLIYGGDEFGNTQYGNNNPYNQDNETGYVKWNNNKLSKSLLSFTKDLIDIRKAHCSIYESMMLTGRDPKSYGFPDFSLHGEELWRADLGPTSHGFGVIYNDRYSSSGQDKLVFVIFNMHWENMKVSLPKLKTQGIWTVRIISDNKNNIDDTKTNAILAPRSFMILETVK